MTMRLIISAAAAAYLLAAGAAVAQTTKPPQPVDVEADQMEIIDADKQAVFRGNVDATRGGTNMKAEEMTVFYADIKNADGTTRTDATLIKAKRSVTITTKKEVITGDWADIDVQKNTLVVGGNVKLVQGATVLQGKELHADLNTNKIQMTGGRVKGSFLPSQK